MCLNQFDDTETYLTGEILEKWKKKRQKTLIGYIIIGAIVGVDYSVILSTLYIYLRDMVGTTYPQFYYGLIIAVFNISSTLFGILSGRYVDKTRKMRFYLNVVFAIQIIGSLMYAIPYSVVFPVIGRLLGGIGDPFINVVSGEVIRIFDEDRGTQALWWLASTYSIGFIVGPGLNVLFKQIHFHIGAFEVNNLNFVGIFMAVLSVLALIVGNTLIHDCSFEFDLKEYLKQNYGDKFDENNEENFINESEEILEAYESCVEQKALIKTTKSDEIPFFIVIKGLGTRFDSVLLFLSTFVFMFILFGTDIMIPLLVTNVFHWEAVAVSYVFLSYGIAYFFILLIMGKFSTSKRSVYVTTLICIFFQILQYVALWVVSISQRNQTLDLILITFILFCWVLGWCIEEVLIRSMVAKMVPSSIQSFTETLRSGLARLSAIIVSLSVPLLMTYLFSYSLIVVCIVSIIFVCFVVRMRSLMSLKEIEFEK